MKIEVPPYYPDLDSDLQYCELASGQISNSASFAQNNLSITESVHC